MATTDTTGRDENPADTNDSIGYSPEWTDDTFADVGHACIEMKSHRDGAVSVGTKGDSDIVTLTVQQSQMMRVSTYIDADTAEWLADQLRDHADKVRGEE